MRTSTALTIPFFIVLLFGCDDGGGSEEPDQTDAVEMADVQDVQDDDRTPDMDGDMDMPPPGPDEFFEGEAIFYGLAGAARSDGDKLAVWCANTGSGYQGIATYFEADTNTWSPERIVFEEGFDAPGRRCETEVLTDGQDFLVRWTGNRFSIWSDGAWFSDHEPGSMLVATNEGFYRPGAVWSDGSWSEEEGPCLLEKIWGGSPGVLGLCYDGHLEWRDPEGNWMSYDSGLNGSVEAVELGEHWFLSWEAAVDVDGESEAHLFAGILTANGLDTRDLAPLPSDCSTDPCMTLTHGVVTAGDHAMVYLATSLIAPGLDALVVGATEGWIDSQLSPLVMRDVEAPGDVHVTQGRNEALFWWQNGDGMEALLFDDAARDTQSAPATFDHAVQIAEGDWWVWSNSLGSPVPTPDPQRWTDGVWTSQINPDLITGTYLGGGGTLAKVDVRPHDVWSQFLMVDTWSPEAQLDQETYPRSIYLDELMSDGATSLGMSTRSIDESHQDFWVWMTQLRTSRDGERWSSPFNVARIESESWQIDALTPAPVFANSSLGTVHGFISSVMQPIFSLIRPDGAEILPEPPVPAHMVVEHTASVAASDTTAAFAWMSDGGPSVQILEDGAWSATELVDVASSRVVRVAADGNTVAVLYLADNQRWQVRLRQDGEWDSARTLHESTTTIDPAKEGAVSLVALSTERFVAFLPGASAGYLIAFDADNIEPLQSIDDMWDDNFAQLRDEQRLKAAGTVACGLVTPDWGMNALPRMVIYDGEDWTVEELDVEAPEPARLATEAFSDGCVFRIPDYPMGSYVALRIWRDGQWLESLEMVPDAGQNKIDIAGNESEVLAAWIDDAGNLAISHHDGIRWSEPAVLQEIPGEMGARAPHAVATESGFLIAWTEFADDHPALRVLRLVTY